MSVEKLITEHIDIWSSALQTRSTAGRGSNGKIDLYGIKKLRELILELAVRGKLVPQDPNDEPASELLKRIAVEKAELVKQGKIKKQKPLPEISEEEKPFELPVGWEWVHLLDVAYPFTGFAFKSAGFNELERGLPLVRIRDVGQSFSGTFYDGEYRDEFLINRNDYLISMDGLFRVASWDGDKALLNQRVTKLIFFGEEANQQFVCECLQQRLRELQGIKAYTTVDHLSGRQIASVLVAFPPKQEQLRIILKVNKLISICDQLEQQSLTSLDAHSQLVETLLATLTNSQNAEELAENWAQISQHFDMLFTTEASIDALKQTILQLAVMGKLVPQDPNDEPASEQLKCIEQEKAQLVKEGKIKKQKPLPPISDEEKPFELPKGWVWCQLTSLFTYITDGDHQAPPKAPDGIPFLVIGNLNRGEVSFNETKFVPKAYFEKLDWSKKPTINDMLYTVTGSYGIPIIVKENRPFCVQRHVAILKSCESTPTLYLRNVFLTHYAYDYATQIATGIAQKTVPLTGLREMKIPLPPANEIVRIIEKIQSLDALFILLKSRLKLSQQIQLHFTDALIDTTVN